ncbi:class I SAM-dependent methyltransferase [Kibdelosporangium philippinense]|uniref:Class I SAM-dependent methyltransferase n=1 Tax=Kibdelosporangium philippinense TaxID=211113 RepID=A0ABS8Z5J1_9PSEU|nr:daptide-type RiPP biosynthesis methyltransferase [Kibdelosporangium philippinense]MCE7003158.1 class I SAM-dependent methyltransferase [Kibdelosporangium philippinense]
MSDQLAQDAVRTTRADVLLASAGERGILCDYYSETAAEIYRDIMDDEGEDTGAISEAQEFANHIPAGSAPVLELAAGAGRLTFPLLDLGLEITALELSAKMVATLSKRLAEAPAEVQARCTAVVGDMADFAFDQQFRAVIISPGTIAVLDDEGRAGLYASVRKHLAPGGQFLVGVGQQNPNKDEPLERFQDLTGASGREYVLHHQRWFPGDEEVHDITIYPADETADPFLICTHRMRIPNMDRIVRECEAAGFDVTVQHFAGKLPQDVLLLKASVPA